MNIGIDISPLKTHNFVAHRVRGSGFYIEQLRKSLQQYYSNNTYTLFSRSYLLPNDIDLVHIPYFEPFFLTLPLRKQFPTVVTVHDLIPLLFPEHFPSGIGGSIKWQIQKFVLNKSNAVITDSHMSKKDIARYTGIPDKKIHVIYLAASDLFKPISDSNILTRTRTKYKLPHKFALYVGDVTWNKNLIRLMSAVKKLNLILVMVGNALIQENFDRTNPWNKDLVRAQELAKDDKRIIRVGFVPTDDLVCLYNSASVFVMPSLYEGFGLPVIEAMACGTPVVTTRAGSLSEVAGDACIYVDPFDTDNIAKGIGEVFFSKDLQLKLQRTGLEQAKKFSWRKTATETIGVYEKILEKQ